MVSDNLARLREITENLPKFPPKLFDCGGKAGHVMDAGSSVATHLYTSPETSAALWNSPAGTEFPEHAHGQTEFLIVITGSMELRIDGKVQTLRRADCTRLDPDTLHDASFSEDCLYYAITIPECDSWPSPPE